jgi:hypothetical protein
MHIHALHTHATNTPHALQVWVEHKYRKDIVIALNVPEGSEARHRFLFYGDTTFCGVKHPATCGTTDLLDALRSCNVPRIRVNCYGEKAKLTDSRLSWFRSIMLKHPTTTMRVDFGAYGYGSSGYTSLIEVALPGWKTQPL